MKSQVMKQAWAIAKEAAAQHGGSSKQYISMAMKQAWAQVQAPVEEVAAVEVEVAVVEAAPAPKKKAAPKKKKKTGEIDFGKWMAGNSTNRTKGAPVVRRTETAAEKKARRAANAEMYAAPKRTPKRKAQPIDLAAWQEGIKSNVQMGR